MVALPVVLSSNSFATVSIFSDSFSFFHTDTIERNDSATIPHDSLRIMPADSVSSDTSQEKPMFSDVITYHGTDSVNVDFAEKKVYLYGDKSVVKYLQTEVTATYIVLDMTHKEAFATGVEDSTGTLVGTPKFKDGAQEFESKEMRYNFETKKGLVTNIITQQGEGYMQGELTKKQNDSVYCIKHGWYTTCDEHDHPHFMIRMQKAKMIKDKRIFATWPHIELEGVKLPIGVPFIFFPITDKGTSGIIMPTYGEERTRGFNLRNGGYYFYINDYVDMAVTGDIYTNGSWALRVGSNYVKRYKFRGSIDFSTSKNFSGEKGLPDYQKSGDWSIRWTHSQDAKANPYATFSASVNMSSSSNNKYNYNNMNDIADQRKQSSITWSKKWPDSPFSLSGSFNHNQNSRDTSISLTLPNLSLRMTQIYPFRKKDKAGQLKWYDNIGISYTGEFKNSISTKEYKLMKSSFVRDWENGYKHTIPISFSFKLSKDITFSPSVTYTGFINLKTIEKVWVADTSAKGGTEVTRYIEGFNYSHQYSTGASIGYTPTIYGMYMFKKESNIIAIRHMIRPSFSFSYTPKIGPLGKYTKTYFNGTEDVEYAIHTGSYKPTSVSSPQNGSISLSIDNNVEMKMKNPGDTTGNEESKKVKLLESLSIRASYNIFADSMNFSTIALAARTRVFNEKVDLNFSATLDPYALNESGGRINKYHGGIGRLTQASITSGFSLSSDNGKNKELKNELLGGYYDNYVDFEVPWNFNINYSMNYSKSGLDKGTINQMLQFSADVSLTEKWKLRMNSGFDITKKEITATSFNITRDLHCWEMTFDCIPFGSHQSYSFRINVRSSMLRDLKLTKRESWYDTR